jgi:hypothetical protein
MLWLLLKWECSLTNDSRKATRLCLIPNTLRQSNMAISQQETFILTGISQPCLMTPEWHDPARAVLKHQVREILVCSV